MIVCPTCHHSNPEAAPICENCGASLEAFTYRACPACNALNPAQNAFCRRCLSELVPTPREAGEEQDLPVRPFEPVARPPEPAVQAFAEEPPEVEKGTAVPLREETAPERASTDEQGPPSEARALISPTDMGPLEGIPHALPLAEAIQLPHQLSVPVTQVPSEAEQLAAELYQQVAQERAPLRAPVRLFPLRANPRLPQGVRSVLYVLVLAAALTSLFSGGLSRLWLQPRPSVDDFASVMAELPANSVVLLSFDYSPAYAGEMDVLALGLMRHLAQRQVRIVAMSTKPAGVGLAEKALRTIGTENPFYAYGEGYVILGYLPGEEAGLRTLNASLRAAFKTDYLRQNTLNDLAIMQGLNTLADLDAVILLSDDNQAVRRWIEQVQSRSHVFLHAVVTAAIQPMLIPYQQSGQLGSLIAGIPEAAEYEAVTGVKPVALGILDGYVALFVLLVLVALVTNIVYVVRREWRSERAD